MLSLAQDSASQPDQPGKPNEDECPPPGDDQRLIREHEQDRRRGPRWRWSPRHGATPTGIFDEVEGAVLDAPSQSQELRRDLPLECAQAATAHLLVLDRQLAQLRDI